MSRPTGILWGFPRIFLSVWDGCGNQTPIPTAAVNARPTVSVSCVASPPFGRCSYCLTTVRETIRDRRLRGVHSSWSWTSPRPAWTRKLDVRRGTYCRKSDKDGRWSCRLTSWTRPTSSVIASQSSPTADFSASARQCFSRRNMVIASFRAITYFLCIV